MEIEINYDAGLLALTLTKNSTGSGDDGFWQTTTTNDTQKAVQEGRDGVVADGVCHCTARVIAAREATTMARQEGGT